MNPFIGGVASSVALTLFLVVPVGLGAEEHQHGYPYSGFGDREIKALSEQELRVLEIGEGYVAGVRTDELDVEHFTIYGLVEGGASEG